MLYDHCRALSQSKLILLTCAVLLASPCLSQPESEGAKLSSRQLVELYVGEARLIGRATLEVVFWDHYDLSLYAAQQPFQGKPPYALEFEYKKGFSTDFIADKSITLIRQQNFQDEIRLAQWHSQLMDIFPDVSKGTVITSIYNTDMQTFFYCDGIYIGQINDPDFSQYFFNIWLGEEASEPGLRRKLIGEDNA